MSTNSTSEPRELVETPDLNGAYPRLDEAGIAALAPLGRRRRVQPEEVLFRVFIGARPCTGWLGGLVDMDDDGFVRTGRDTGSSPLERRAQRLGQAGRHGGRRGCDGHQARLRKEPGRDSGRRIPEGEAQ